MDKNRIIDTASGDFRPQWSDEQRLRAATGDLSELEVIGFMPDPMRKSMQEILKIGSDATPEAIVDALGRAGGYATANWWRGMKVSDSSTWLNSKGVEYREIVTDLAGQIGVKYDNGESVARMEQQIVAKLLSDLPEAERQKLEQDAALVGQEEAEKLGVNWTPGVATVVALSAAQLSGFGVYTLASTAAAGMAGLVGATLPFAFYTGMSKLISIAIGPVGWFAAGGYLINELTGPEPKKTLPCVLVLAGARGLLQEVAKSELPPEPEPAASGSVAIWTVLGILAIVAVALFAVWLLLLR